MISETYGYFTIHLHLYHFISGLQSAVRILRFKLTDHSAEFAALLYDTDDCQKGESYVIRMANINEKIVPAKEAEIEDSLSTTVRGIGKVHKAKLICTFCKFV